MTEAGGVQPLVLAAKEMRFDALVCGPGSGELVLLLHGFPQFADSWLPLMPRLAAADYHVVAVDQRGYSRGARPPDVEAYSIGHLVSDVLAFADELGAPRFHLVGHDWGGLVAWQLAADHPDRLRSLSVLSTPHPEAFRATVKTDFDQMKRSKYLLLFKMPGGVPETTLLGLNAAVLRRVYQGRPPAQQVESNVRRLSEAGAMTAALNWYRALEMDGHTAAVAVPSLYIWSDEDIALGETAALQTASYVTGEYRFERMRGLSHWLVDEAPDTVAAMLVEHVQKYSMGNRMAGDAAVAFAKDNGERFVEELIALLRIPSISTAPDHIGDVRRAAEFCAAALRRIGLANVRLVETSTDESVVAARSGPGTIIPARIGHPLVLAEWLDAGPAQPTVLMYGHYDVQPAEPLDEWNSPPFEPAIRNGNIYARGAVDDKGQMWMHVKALESLMVAGGGRLPVNVRVILEGEEEVGGEGIAAFVREHGDQLKADVALVSDTEMLGPGIPTLCVGLRGMIYTEIEARGARTDLHSGMYGGVAPNPLVALAQIIAKLKDDNGRILIPGFYDKVLAPTADERRAWAALPFDEEHYRETEVGSTELTGEPGLSVMERTWARPTLDVHGMPGGFIGVGAKTVIPARAIAKISMRLVPEMTPAGAFAQYKAYVESICPRGIQLSVRLIHSGDPIVVSTDNKYVQAAQDAMRTVFKADTVFVRGGGSIPIVGDFVRELGIPTLMMGFGLPDDNLHAPNEKFHLANFHMGIESIVRWLSALAA